MRWRCAWGVLLSVLLLAGTALWAQEITGSISGTVRDPSKAVVPNATVTVRNTDQNIVVRTVKTDASGNYTALNLLIGHYSVTVQAEGFKKYVKAGIVVNVNDHLAIDADLQVGATSQVVEVQAAPVEVDLRSATTSGLVTGDQIRNLTLNNRNWIQLVTLMPGVSNTGSESMYIGVTNPFGGNNVLGMSINGQRTSANNWTLDGADNVDRGSNLTLMMMPSVDSIAEFKVLRSNYSAESGRSGAAQINVITRAGTSQFHGGAYEFWRNENLNADSYFGKQTNRYYQPNPLCELKFNGGLKATGPTPNCDTRPALRYHDFGGTFGGPLYIPGLYNKKKDKTFFFFSEEVRRITQGQLASQVLLPSQDMLNGNFPFPICVALNADGTCAQTASQITNISPLAQAYIKDIWSKVPTSPDGMTYQQFNMRSTFNFREELLKIDHVFGPRLAVYGKYIHDTIPTYEPMGIFGPNSYIPGVGDTQTNSPGWSFVGRATATFNPNTLLEVGYNFSYGAILSEPTGLMNIKNSPDIKATLPFPVTLNAVPGIGSSYYGGLGTHPHYEDFNRNHQVLANFTKIMGKHNIKVGGTYYHYQKTENAAGSNTGSFTFRYYGTAPLPPGVTTTQMREMQSWANFLLGRANAFSQASLDLFPDVRANQFEFYAQDEFRATHNLTVNYGLRWSFFRQPTDAKGMLTNFDPATYDPTQAPIISSTTGNIVNYTTANLLNGMAPTTAALATCQKLLASKQLTYCWPEGTKAPYGNAVGRNDNRAIAPRVGIAWDPKGDGKTSIRSGFGMFYDTGLFGTVEQNIFANPPFVQTLSLAGTTNGVQYIPFDNPVGNLAISSSPKSPGSRVDPNFTTPYTMNWNLGVQRNITATTLLDVSYVGSRSNHQLGASDINQPPAGAYLNYPFLGNATTGVTNSTLLNYIRPYQGWGPEGSSTTAIRTQYMANYHGLQASLDKRFKGANMLGIAYTWSRAMTNNMSDRSNPPRDVYNPQLEYGPTLQDRRQIFSANFLYELPIFKQQKGIAGHILGGWQLTGITAIQTGSPVSYISNSFDALDLAGQGCRGSSACNNFANQISNDLYGYIGQNYPKFGPPIYQSLPILSTKTFLKNESYWYWFNPAAFGGLVPGVIANGNSHRGAIYGPGMWRQDLTMAKTFKFTERFNGQFRLDAFNVFNHTNPSGINTTGGSYGFGQVTSTLSPRIMQLGLKLNF